MAPHDRAHSEDFEYRRAPGRSRTAPGDEDDERAKPWWRIALWGLVIATVLATPLRILWPGVCICLGLNFALSANSARRRAADALPAEPLKAPYRDWVEQGQATHSEIQAVIARLPVSLRGTFAPLADQARDLVADLETLSQAAQQMDTYLTGPHARRTAPEIQRLHAELRQCADPITREQLQQALRALEDTLADQKEIRTLSERAKAVAANILASLESVFSEVMKQRYTDLDTAQSEYDSAAARLQAVKSHVDAVQQVITNRGVPGQ